MVKYTTATLGFARIGPNRELKFALEKYWRKDITAADLLTIANDIEAQAWQVQCDAGIDHITVEDYALYLCLIQQLFCQVGIVDLVDNRPRLSELFTAVDLIVVFSSSSPV